MTGSYKTSFLEVVVGTIFIVNYIYQKILGGCKKDGGSPDARLRLARLWLARLRLNDGAKLCVSFKLCKYFFFLINQIYQEF